MQAAEDARIITIRKIKAEDDAEAARARSNAEATAQQAQQIAQQQADARAQAEAESERARAAQQEAKQSEQQAQQQEQQMRERLRQQLSQVLQTRETARGLIMNMSDVLFDFNKYTLKPDAREKLAKVSGILLAYPDLKIQVEGYTDNVGSDDYNQKLSEERASSVRDYLASQEVPANNITAQGYGKNDPVADNSSGEGRAQNRRVELVVSGAAIGVQESRPGGGQSQVNPQPNPAGNTGVSSPQQ